MKVFYVEVICDKLISTVRKSDFFLIRIFAKEKVPQYISAKRQIQTGLKEYSNGSLNDSAISIQYKNLLNHC